MTGFKHVLVNLFGTTEFHQETQNTKSFEIEMIVGSAHDRSRPHCSGQI